jgi:hypothetical protein
MNGRIRQEMFEYLRERKAAEHRPSSDSLLDAFLSHTHGETNDDDYVIGPNLPVLKGWFKDRRGGGRAIGDEQ